MGPKSHSQQKIVRLSIVFLLILFAAGILIGANKQSKELKAILENPLANLQLTTAVEVNRSYNDQKTGTLYRKPIYAELRLEYEPIGSFTKDDVFDEIVESTKREGWDRKDSGAQDNYYVAQYSQDQYLHVEIFNHMDTPAVRVVISHS